MNIPYARTATITKSDTVNLDNVTDAIYVGGAGVVAVVKTNDEVEQFTCVAGQELRVKAKRVNSTNTTASLLVALNY